jgi:hypothetical protein
MKRSVFWDIRVTPCIPVKAKVSEENIVSISWAKEKAKQKINMMQPARRSEAIYSSKTSDDFHYDLEGTLLHNSELF